MHAVNVAGQAVDHRVIVVIERSEEPALLGSRWQAAEQVAQRLGAGQQQAGQRGVPSRRTARRATAGDRFGPRGGR